MVAWRGFEHAAPELAALAKGRFDATEFVLLGTLKKDGWPRITPVEFTFFDGELTLGGMWQSKKARDLLRDGRCVVHSATTNKNGLEGDAKLYGRATPIAPEREETYWQHIFERLNWRPDGPAHVFTIDIEAAAYVRFSGDGTMEWLTWPGNRWRSKKSS